MSGLSGIVASQTLTIMSSNKPNIIIASVDLYDYSAGEPSEEFMTVLRAIHVR